MKITKKVRDIYNKPESLLVISSFPRIGETYSKGVCAVASFTKNTLVNLKKQHPDRKIIVLTMVLTKEEVYVEDDMLIVRCFRRNDPLSYFKLLRAIRQFNKVSDVLVEFEFSSFGNILATTTFSVILAALWLLRKRTTLVIHQVLFDLKQLAGHVGMDGKSLRLNMYTILLSVYYWFICLFAKHIVVLEEELKKRLARVANKRKITVIPHGVDTTINTKVTKAEARKKLHLSENEVVILYFGYVTWYKGVDALIQAFQKIHSLSGKKARLIIAGGESFTQGTKAHYTSFYNSIVENVAKATHITLTGFLPEQDIPAYFQAADLVIYPYRAFMSSSGPLSLALSFEKPFILSSHLSSVTKSQDIQDVMETTGLKTKDVTFALTNQGIKNALSHALQPNQFASLTAFSTLLSEKRSFANSARIYAPLLTHTPAVSVTLQPPLAVTQEIIS